MLLRALEPTDLELLYTIENDPEMWNVGDACVPYSRYDLKNYILNQQHDIHADKQLRLVICADEQHGDGKAVGLIDLFNYSPQHNRAELGLAILRSEQGKGYATEALHQMNDYARNVLHIHQLYSVVSADNQPSLTMLRSAGYCNETILHDWLATPQGYKDCIALFLCLN
jgi:diamine N-acetyltransferase